MLGMAEEAKKTKNPDYPKYLKRGNPKPGVALPQLRIRMPDEQSAAELMELFDAAPWGHGPLLLGELLKEAMQARKARAGTT